MNAEVKKAWVAALRSGEYKPGQAWLRNSQSEMPDRYCCLGVLCDLHARSAESHKTLGWAFFDYSNAWKYGGDAALPSDAVKRWAMLETFDAHKLARMNDSGKSFAEIADYIEEKL
jgi:hypothetical protein